MDTFHAKNLEDWHNWLLQNHHNSREIWLVFFKTGSAKTSIRYEEAVEEALCFGWIDSLIKNRDAESHLRKFTPRKPGSRWSELNIRRAQRMVEQGRMTAGGLALFAESKQTTAQSSDTRKEQQELWRVELTEMLPIEVREIFTSLAPSHQRQYAGWVMSGKKEETRRKRIDELSLSLIRGEELGLK